MTAIQNTKMDKDRKISAIAHILLMGDTSENNRLNPSNTYSHTSSVVAWKERTDRFLKKNRAKITGTLFRESQKWCGRIGAITDSHSIQ
nr:MULTISPECIES: hypothetical protein [Ichthyocystis]